MVTADGKIKLTDFGIAKDLDATALTATGRTLGTAAYMSPEQIRGTPAVSHKTDLYALGVVLYQMLVGKPPFEGSTPVVLMHCHLNEPPPRPSAKVAGDPQGARRADRDSDGQGARGPALGRGGRRRQADRAARQGRARRSRSRWSGRQRSPARAKPPSRGRRRDRPLRRRRIGRGRARSQENPQVAARLPRTASRRTIGRRVRVLPGSPAPRSRPGSSRWPWSRSADSSATGSGPPAQDTSTSRPRPSWPRPAAPTG